MEKNCTNCKYNIEVVGADYGFCNSEDHLGRISSEYTCCSSYEAVEVLNVSELDFNEVIQALICCTDPRHSCAECPFNRYKHTCQRDLMIAAKAVIEHLQATAQGYVVDQGIWLTVNKTLEKENKELWDSYHKGYAVGYAYGKQDALSADRAESKTANEETENVK